MANAWDDMKRLAQSAFHDVANSYQDILIRGHLLPNRHVDMHIAEAEYDRLHTPEPEHLPEMKPPEPGIEPEV
jgi:hypothetical protein